MTASLEHQDRKGTRILIAGTGGQGALTAAAVLSGFLVDQGHDVISAQLHGMAQRGGSVQSTVMIDCGISPAMGSGQADCVLGLEPVETTRALPFVSSSTIVFMNTAVVVPYVLGQRTVLKQENSEYPEVEELIKSIRAVATNVFPFDASELANEAGSTRTMNTVMLGCLLGSGILPHTADKFWSAAAEKMPPAWMKSNETAFMRGVEVGRQSRLGGEGK